MRRKLGIAVLAGLISLVGLTGFGSETMLTPARLQAQGCGAFNGKPCSDVCTRECTNGSCCAWSHYYYSTATE